MSGAARELRSTEAFVFSLSDSPIPRLWLTLPAGTSIERARMANPEHLAILQQGVEAWNAWRAKEPSTRPDLSGADLSRTDLSGADLNGADLSHTNINRANLENATLIGANLNWTDLSRAHMRAANLSGAYLGGADIRGAHAEGANLSGAHLERANLGDANLIRANLEEGDFTGANFSHAIVAEARLRRARLTGAYLGYTILAGADLRDARLRGAAFVETCLEDAVLSGSHIYGISAWNLKLNEGTKQRDLVITRRHEPEVTVDNIEVAQFVYLILRNEKIREVIDTITTKAVLLLGRFTEGRIQVLERLRDTLRQRGYVPIVFNFDKPETKDFTETVRLLAGMSKFVIADITNPKSSPLELQSTIPEIMVPLQPIIAEGEQPFAMLQDLWIKHRDWVFPPIQYSSIERLVEVMDAEIVAPAEARFNELVLRRAQEMPMRRV